MNKKLGVPLVPKCGPGLPGKPWKLSDEAKRDIEEIERHSFWWPHRWAAV